MLTATLLLALSLGSAASVSAPPDENPLALNDPMKEYLDKHIDRATEGLQQLRTLVHLTFEDNALGFTYQPVTRTAIGTYSNHGGNCLSFTFLFVAMARYLGLKAKFREVDIIPIWSEVGNLTSISGHIDVVIYLGSQEYFVDLFPRVYTVQLGGRVIYDARAIAHFWSNRGVEELNANYPTQATAYFQRAMEIDPTADFAWDNLGVARAISQDSAKAERCYEEALHIDKKDSVAMSDLASLYERTGRFSDARRFREKVRRFNQENPYYHFRLGLQAYHLGHYRESLEHLRAALRLKSSDHSFYLAMARDYVRLNDLEKARKNIRLALKNAPDQDWKALYNQKLEWLAARLSHS